MSRALSSLILSMRVLIFMSSSVEVRWGQRHHVLMKPSQMRSAPHHQARRLFLFAVDRQAIVVPHADELSRLEGLDGQCAESVGKGVGKALVNGGENGHCTRILMQHKFPRVRKNQNSKSRVDMC